MTKTGERLIKSAKQAAAMARDGEIDVVASLKEMSEALSDARLPGAWLTKKAAHRIQELEAHVEALQDKLWEHDCACSYDEPGDVCMMHSPMVNKLKTQLSGVHAGTHCIVEKLKLHNLRAYLAGGKTYNPGWVENEISAMLTESKET